MSRFSQLDTPAVLIDLDRVEANLKRVQDYADSHGLKLRPHIKTHKLPRFARRAMELGAVGITVQKLGEAEVMEADLVISFKVFRERFGSRVTLFAEDKKIETEYLDGPFRYMKSHWIFSPREDGSCDVSFYVDFEFKNAVLQGIIGVVFNEAMHRIVKAFEDRVATLYG
mgnify:CR=1 FL=1